MSSRKTRKDYEDINWCTPFHSKCKSSIHCQISFDSLLYKAHPSGPVFCENEHLIVTTLFTSTCSMFLFSTFWLRIVSPSHPPNVFHAYSSQRHLPMPATDSAWFFFFPVIVRFSQSSGDKTRLSIKTLIKASFVRLFYSNLVIPVTIVYKSVTYWHIAAY